MRSGPLPLGCCPPRSGPWCAAGSTPFFQNCPTILRIIPSDLVNTQFAVAINRQLCVYVHLTRWRGPANQILLPRKRYAVCAIGNSVGYVRLPESGVSCGSFHAIGTLHRRHGGWIAIIRTNHRRVVDAPHVTGRDIGRQHNLLSGNARPEYNAAANGIAALVARRILRDGVGRGVMTPLMRVSLI